MITNLIFKRPVTVEGKTKVVTRIVRVNIPDIDSGEGWTLSGHADSIEICEGVYAHPVAPAAVKVVPVTVNSETIINPVVDPVTVTVCKVDKADSTKFQSDVKGTAKLVRSKGVIKIVARRGKTTYNQTTPNSVCINDFTKNEFFKSCREKHGNTGVFEFKSTDGTYYDYWNDVIDKEYQRQKSRVEATTYKN